MAEIRFYSLDREQVENFVSPSRDRIISGTVRLGISKHRTIVLLLVIITSSAVVAWFVLKYTSDWPMSFERTRWMQARNEDDSRVLTRMAKDLIGRRALIGETRTQLVEMLGAPENYTDATNRQMYYLVREDWDWIDPVRRDHLLVSLDQNGRAIDARIVSAKKLGH